MKQKISDTSPSISDGGRLKDYWASRIVNPKYSQPDDKYKDVDMTGMLTRYNLKGFEFGRWMTNNDRYDSLHAFERAIQTLEAVVGSKNLGLDLLVGVAFGARGRGGGAVAHYEPCYNMINLTKERGSGSLAHEWAHAIDYNLGRFVDQNKEYDALSGGHSLACTLPKNTGAQLRYWCNAVVDEIIITDSYARLKGAGDYWHRRTEIWARFFEQYICYQSKIKGLNVNYLTKSWSHYISSPAYLREDEFKKIANGSMFSFMLVLKGVLNNKYNLTACGYKYYDTKHMFDSSLYPLLKSEMAKEKKSIKLPKQKKEVKKVAKKAVKKVAGGGNPAKATKKKTPSAKKANTKGQLSLPF